MTTYRRLTWLFCLPLATVAVGQEPIAADFAERWADEPIVVSESTSSSNTTGGRTGALANSLLAQRLVVQFGYSYLWDEEDDLVLTQHSVPDLLIRYGITDRIELRLGWSGMIFSRLEDRLFDEEVSVDDWADPSLGIRIRLNDQKHLLPQLQVLASTPIATDGNPFALDSLQPTASLAYSWMLGPSVTVSGGTGVVRYVNDGDDGYDLQQLASIDWALTDSFGSYTQWSGLWGLESDTFQHTGTAGVYYSLTDHVQLDLFVGLGLNAEAPDLVTGVGMSYGF